MDLLGELKGLDVNVDEGIDRVMGNEELYRKMLGKLCDMIRDSDITADFDDNDYEDVILKVHAIKGTAGNLSVTPLYTGYMRVLELLRADKPGEARELLKKILPIQKEIVACIEKYM